MKTLSQPIVQSFESPQHPDSCSFRVLAIGIVSSLIIGLGATYNMMVIHGSCMAIGFSRAAKVYVFFVLAFIRQYWTRTFESNVRPENHGIENSNMMLVVACSTPTMRYSAQIRPIITAPFHFATPENNWGDMIQSHINAWLTPQSELGINYFYEGLSSWEPRTPWYIRLRPWIIWASLAITVYFVTICIMLTLSTQWMEHERLAYPLARLSCEKADRKCASLLKPLFRNRPLWLGFASRLA